MYYQGPKYNPKGLVHRAMQTTKQNTHIGKLIYRLLLRAHQKKFQRFYYLENMVKLGIQASIEELT